MNDVFEQAGQPNTPTRASLLKLNQPLRRTNQGQNNISYIAPIIWYNLPNSLKTTNNLNTYKHRVKEHFFTKQEMRQTIYIATFNFFFANAQPLFIFIVIIFIIITLIL